jgi:NADH:ubiquinone oxidoreductase subunit 6 (subunit J)
MIFLICFLLIIFNFINFFFKLHFIFIFVNIILCALLVVISNSSINSIFFLITIFLQVSLYLINLHLDFFAFIYIIIYVGAIAIFFLFIIMMLNLNINLIKFYSVISIIENGIILFSFSQIFFLNFYYLFSAYLKNDLINLNVNKYNYLKDFFNFYDIIGLTFYTYYNSYFILIGFFLFIIMIGSILITQETRFYIRKQDTFNLFLYNNSNTISAI